MSENWDETMAQLDPSQPPSKVRVLDLIHPDTPRVSAEERDARMVTCKGCDRLKLHAICGECMCIMSFKTWLKDATCPLAKW
jgi:hypothetical protein